MGEQWTLTFSQRDNRIPNLNASIRAQHKHGPAKKAVRVNGKISEVKQPQYQSNSKMGDHLGFIHFVFLVVEILGKLDTFAKFYKSASTSVKLNWILKSKCLRK